MRCERPARRSRSDLGCIKEATEDDSSGSLNVIVEDSILIAEPVEVLKCVVR